MNVNSHCADRACRSLNIQVKRTFYVRCPDTDLATLQDGQAISAIVSDTEGRGISTPLADAPSILA